MGCARVARTRRSWGILRFYISVTMQNFKRMIWCISMVALSACDANGDVDPMSADGGTPMDTDGSVLDGAVAVGDGGVDLGGCEAGQPCRCPRAERDGRLYVLCPDAVNHAEAVAACASAGLTLLAIDSAEEQEWVWGMSGDMFPEGTKDVWIGLNDHAEEGAHAWPDGSAPEFTNWAERQPDNGAGGVDEDCVEMSQYTGGQWNDIDCSLEYLGFICEA